MMKFFWILPLIFWVSESWCQVNGYAEVTSITGTTLNLSNVNQTYDAFEVGGKAIVIQIQDNVIGSTADDASFGDMGSIGSAGLYEVVIIASLNLPSSLTISGTLKNSYSTGTNSSLQIVTYPTLDNGGGNFTTTGNITAVNWNGNVGGVIAFKVTGTLTLLHNITADGAGFRGGAINNDGNSAVCTSTIYRIVAGTDYANKGEGIFNRTAGYQEAARGKIVNGGGGGNSHNAGGGGGGNYSSGGDGGPGWPTCSPSAGGLGGLALSAYISSSRVFMGGGGGAGEGNDGYSTAGGNGGGIILISANELQTTSGCSGVAITANGINAPNTSGNDGAGGAGAAGSIVLDIQNYNVDVACQLAVESSGGDGGDVNYIDTHGGGGGGGMGVVVYSIPTPTTYVTTTTDPGSGGANDNSGTGGSASSGDGTPGSGGGIVDNIETPLPVELIKFEGWSEGDQVVLSWSTATEINNDYFEVQMSGNGQKFVTVGKVNGHGTTREIRHYSFSHFNPNSGINYYRLKQVDFDGMVDYSKTILVDHTISFGPFQISIYPNPPADDLIRLKIFSDTDENAVLTLSSLQGEVVDSYEVDPDQLKNGIVIDCSSFPSGIYLLSIKQGNFFTMKKIILP